MMRFFLFLSLKYNKNKNIDDLFFFLNMFWHQNHHEPSSLMLQLQSELYTNDKTFKRKHLQH